MTYAVETYDAFYPQPVVTKGKFITLEPLSLAHADDLFSVLKGEDALWDYMGYGPYANVEEFKQGYINYLVAHSDVSPYTIVDNTTGKPIGVATFLRIDIHSRAVEVGHLMFSPKLQRTKAATEAMYLMATLAFDKWNYRRYEWKCNDANGPSKNAALRLGFTFEGLFRKHMIIKGKSRDTAWFAMLDDEWPKCKAAFEQWLDDANFDSTGAQIKSLKQIRDSL
ncbi:hypothetical protein TRVA0_049S00254 [Trichomonascus vanleenenianus]|uniref:uncharacterized protein n=1 Tax=Trichomonascus vanleenenianus TaxID=2268995 RepID=UPI003EC999B5